MGKDKKGGPGGYYTFMLMNHFRSSSNALSHFHRKPTLGFNASPIALTLGYHDTNRDESYQCFTGNVAQTAQHFISFGWLLIADSPRMSTIARRTDIVVGSSFRCLYLNLFCVTFLWHSQGPSQPSRGDALFIASAHTSCPSISLFSSRVRVPISKH